MPETDDNHDGKLDIEPSYKDVKHYENCSFYWTSTKTNLISASDRYSCSDEENEAIPYQNCIDFGYCNEDSKSISDTEIKFIEYCPGYGFSIRLIKE